MKRISQMIAVVNSAKTETDQRVSQLKHVAANEDLFKGHERTYRPRADGGVQEPSASLKVRTSADEILSLSRQALTRLWDAMRTLDDANTGAYGDVELDGKVLLAHVPAGHLNWLTRELDRLHDVWAALPELDQSKEWKPEGHGLSKNGPVESTRTKKVPVSTVLYEATPNHPANVLVRDEDEIIGYWSQVNFSGAIAASRKRELIDRIARLRDAVRVAREGANASVEAEEKKEADAIFDWLLRP